MIFKRIYYKLRVILIFTILTFSIGVLHFPSQFIIPSAHAALPAIALPYAANVALNLGRVVLLNGTRVAANDSIYATAAANDMIYGSIAANAESFIVPSVATLAGTASTGGSAGYLSSAALALIGLTGAAAYYTNRDGEKVDISGAGNEAENPLDIADSPDLSELPFDDRNYDEVRNNQALSETGDPDQSKPKVTPLYRYFFVDRPDVYYESAGKACGDLMGFWRHFNPPDSCSGRCELRSPRLIGMNCYFMQACPRQCDGSDWSLAVNPRRDLNRAIGRSQISTQKKCSDGTMLTVNGGCQADYSKDPTYYPPTKFPSTPEYENKPTGIAPHPQLTPAIDPKTKEVPIGNTDNPDATVKAKNNPDGSLAILAQIKGILLDIEVKLAKIQQGQTDIADAIERAITGSSLKHEEDGSKEPITIINNTYYDIAGNEYNVSYIIRENPGANPKPISPGDKIVLPDGTVIQPNYDPTDYPKDDIETTTKTEPVPDPNPDPNPNPNPVPIKDTVTKTKIDPRTGDVVEETTTTITKPDGSKDITVTVNIQGDPKSNPDPQPTPEPTKFEWKCGIDGTPACQVTQDVGKLSDSDWSDLDVPPANYTSQLKEKLFGTLFNNFTYSPPTSSVCPVINIDLSSVGLAGHYWFSQPYVMDYHCKNLLEPLYSELRALFQIGWLMLAIFIVLSA